MFPEPHAKIMNILGHSIFSILLFIPICFLILASKWGFVFLFIIYPLGLIAYFVFRYQKVHCSMPDCKGKMLVEKTRRSYNTVVYTYICPDCGRSYKADAFELESGGSAGRMGGD